MGYPNPLSMYLMTYGSNFYAPANKHDKEANIKHLGFSPFGIMKSRMIKN